MVSPIALFYSRKDGVLMPLAIQLFQKPSDTNPVGCFQISQIFSQTFLEQKTDLT